MEKEIKPKEVEIDLFDLARKLWNKRIFIVKVTSCFFILGILVAAFSAKEYTSSIVMVPQSSDGSSKLGGLSGLASMAGINLSDMGGDQSISPSLYPQIMGSVTFQKELMRTQVKFEKIDKSISVFDFYTNDKYKSFSLIGAVAKYTIGLPGVIMNSLKGKREEVNMDSSYLRLTENEKNVINMLNGVINLSLNEKDGYISLSANAPEPLVATQLVLSAQALLQKYITKIKIEKAQENLDFIQGRYEEARHDYEQAQIRLASFQDLNRNVILSVTKVQEQKLTNDYSLAFTIFSEMAKQLEQAKIKVKDASPVLTIVQPAFVPIERSKPKRALIVFTFLFLGVFTTCCYVLMKYGFKNLKEN
jgi:uncharacterized protein involved in exopolysaccharide biosynthesis